MKPQEQMSSYEDEDEAAKQTSLYTLSGDLIFPESGVMPNVRSDANDSELGFGRLQTADICVVFSPHQPLQWLPLQPYKMGIVYPFYKRGHRLREVNSSKCHSPIACCLPNTHSSLLL